MSKKTLICIIKNSEFLESIYKSPKYKGQLADDIGVSKSTIYNMNKRLNEHQLVVKENGKYTLTNKGRIALITYSEYKERVDVLIDNH